jgi:hypothetical protein
VLKDAVRLRQAQELSSICGMPARLCYQALLIHHDNGDHAMNWVMSHGSRFMSDGGDVDAKDKGEGAGDGSEALDDTAALEDVGSADVLAASLMTSRDGTVATSPKAAAVPSGAGEGVDDAAAAVQNSHRAAMGAADVELDTVTMSRDSDVGRRDLGLRVGTLLCVSRHMGPSPRLTGLYGTVVPNGVTVANGKTWVVLQQLDTNTGVAQRSTVALECLRRVVKVAGRRVDSAAGLRSLAAANDVALATHFARRAVATLLSHWPQTVPLTTGAFE